MNIKEIDSISVKGIFVRTTNADEMNPLTAKIGTLWETFYSEVAPRLNQNARVFGVYTHYESDHTGAFDVIACTDLIDAVNLKQFHINAGRYLVFRKIGEMPQAVIDLWGEVWAYFSSPNCAHSRTFTTDFEWYKSENEIEIYISVR